MPVRIYTVPTKLLISFGKKFDNPRRPRGVAKCEFAQCCGEPWIKLSGGNAEGKDEWEQNAQNVKLLMTHLAQAMPRTSY